MFGAYRLILACFVALSHFGLVVSGFNPGQWAVVSFYVLSGFLMERQFLKLSTSGECRHFYLDRLLRIYPLFITVVLLSSLLTLPSFYDLAINCTLFPLNYTDFSRKIMSTNIPILVGPSWSLACEACFYLLVPLFARASTRVIRLVATCSIVFFIFSPFMPHSIYWSYIALPGILFAFLSGILIQRKDYSFLLRLWLFFGVLLAAFGYTKFGHLGLPTGIHINVCIGYLAAVPIISRLSSFSPKVLWDQRLGLLSFPLFLIHEPVMEFIKSHFSHPSMWFLFLCSITSAFMLVLLIEKPFDKIRYRLRKNLPVTNKESKV